MSGFGCESSPDGTPVLVSSVPPEECFGVANSVFVLGEEETVCAVTDRGAVLPLVRYEALITPDTRSRRPFDPDRDLNGFLAMIEEVFLARLVAPHCQMQRVRELNPASNCHGWTFLAGQHGIGDQYVPVILDQHGYEVVEEPRYGDLAIYRGDNDAIVHSGFVRLTVPGHEILVESKWGPFGVFLHSAEAHHGRCMFYRTARHSDTLKLVPKRR